MATKPKREPLDDACQAKTGTEEQQDPAGKDKGNVAPVAEDSEEPGKKDE
jgi:hypothetical protein